MVRSLLDFHPYLVGRETIVIGNSSEENVLSIRTYQGIRCFSVILSMHGGCDIFFYQLLL